MLELLKILLFSKIILLTPFPVDIDPGVSYMISGKSVSSINSGAVLRVDVSSMIPPDKLIDMSLAENWVNDNFTEGSLRANLHCDKCANDIVLNFHGYTSWNKNSLYLILNSKSGVPVGVDFTRIEIHSEVELNDVKIEWVNYKK